LIEPIKESDELSDEEVEQIIQENRGWTDERKYQCSH
jgi:hypothetical protein